MFAGDDGFDVQVGGHTQLTGGIITASQSAEEQGKNRFQSGSISQIDLHNISKYDGSSIGFGTSVAVSGKTLGQEQQAGKIQLSDVASQNASGFSSGYGHDSDHQESTTKSGIGTRNIILTDEAGQLAKTGYGTDKAIQLAYTDIRTEDAGQQSGSLKNRFDADKVQSELDLQRNVSQQFSQTVGTAQGMLNEKIDALKQQQEAGDITEADYAQKLKQLQHSQVFLNMVAAALSAPTDSAAGIAAATAAPAISYGIGQEFKKHNKEGSATHIASHMALGAVVSALGGNDAVNGALAAGGAEALVPLFSKAMYGTTDPEQLTAEDKQNLSNMARLFGAAVGAATGNGAANGYADVAQGSLNAGNAVENNGLTNKYGEAKLNPEGKALNAKLVQAGVKSADFYHDLMIKCGNNNECINQVETAQDKAELESGKVVLDLYHNGKLSTHELDTYLGKYSDTMMRGAAEGEGKNRNNPDAYSMNAANWTPAGVQSNPYLNQLIQEYHLDKLRKNGASEKEIRNHVEQYQAISRYVSSEFNSTVAIKNIMTLKAAQLTPYLVIKLLTRGKGVAPNTNITNVNPSKQSSTNNKNGGVAKDGQSFGNLGNPNPNNLGATKVTSSNVTANKTGTDNKPLNADYFKQQYGANNVQQGGGSSLKIQETKNRLQEKQRIQLEREKKTGLDFDHFVGGDFNQRSGKPNGGHSLTRGDVRVVQRHGAPDKNGVYQATVEIRDANGNWHTKTNKSGKPMTIHTMFPANWSEARIRREVTSAWESKGKKIYPNGKWEAKTPSGIKVEGWLNPRKTAYPIYEP